MSHPFDKLGTCQCERCHRERMRRAAQSIASYNQRPKLRKPKRAAVKRAERYVDPLDQGDNLGESNDF